MKEAVVSSLSSVMLLLLLLPCINAFLQPAPPSPWPLNVSDQQSLLAFKSAIKFDPNDTLINWTPNVTFCKWAGITCTPHSHMRRVMKLNLSHMGLEGTISPLLGNLSALQSLDLSNNTLHGHIPPQLGQLSNAKELVFVGNQLEGTIPASLGGCKKLIRLAFSDNRLQGTIPPELSLLTHLEILHLDLNSLTGTIPATLGNLSCLTEMNFTHNDLVGIIPDEVGMLTQLKMLDFSSNELSGSIPSSVGNLSSLIELTFGANNLTGPIPAEVGKLTKLQRLRLWSNKLSGDIPSSIWQNLTALTKLTLSLNNLSGSIGDLSPLGNLQILYLWGNNLSGTIPNSIGNCSKLQLVSLAVNSLTGMVPVEVGKLHFLKRIALYDNLLVDNNSSLYFLTAFTNCSHLETLWVSSNDFSGVLPSAIGHLSSLLSYLNLGYNKTRGNIPHEIANLTNLTFLNLGHNLFSGCIPPAIKSLHKLERLDLSDNSLEGSIPEEIGQLENLGLLNVSWNNLSGRIPSSLGRLQQLRRLFLNNNHISGTIPTGLARCHNLELLDFSHNHLRGKIPREVFVNLKNLAFYLNLSWNSLRGSLPQEISSIVNAQAIDISGNHLDGQIPAALADCVALSYLNLSHNAFEGQIPDALYKLQNLQDLDLSSNFVSGSVPMSLKQLKMLSYINACFNNLTGEIPEGLFLNKTIVLLTGNPGLCGPKEYLLSACAKQGQGKHSILKKGIIVAAGVIVLILCSSILGILWRSKFLKGQIDLSHLMLGKLGYPKFSYEDLVNATSGFNETNLLGVGSFGSVYKGTLRDGRVVAIKVLHLQNQESQKSFKTECKILGRLRHRNLIRVISACSYHNFNGLLLEFAPNGSLENHLYSGSREADDCELGLGEYLNIAIDVAHGMEYLHHDCCPQVIHCDLKPSNVLLDADMKALVSDFSISKLMSHANDKDSLTSSSYFPTGSIGYIAPEYGLGQCVSAKGDVYSYGILLLEIITRKRPTDSMFVGDLNLRTWVRSSVPERLANIVDERLLAHLTIQQQGCLVSLIHVGLLCTNESPQERPTMRDVGRRLEILRSTFLGNVTRASHLASTISDLVHNVQTSYASANSQSSTY